MLKTLEGIQATFNSAQKGGKKVSLADLIVLAGCAGVEQAAKNGGQTVTVPFTPGRMDASQEQTDVESFAVLEPVADGFRNFQKARFQVSAEALLIDRAQLLTLTAPEMTVLVGGMRVLNTNVDGSKHGVFTQAARSADQRLLRQPARHAHGVEGRRRRPTSCSKPAMPAPTRSNGPARASIWCSARTRSCARWPRSTAARTRSEKFVNDFVAAWDKVMNLDRFDVR